MKEKKWIDGDTLVKMDGARQEDFELNGNGYTAKLSEFIRKREASLDEHNRNIKRATKKSLPDKEAPAEMGK